MNLQSCATASLVESLRNPDFQFKHKTESSAFTRNRKLNFISIAAMILRMVKQSLQIACNWLGDFMDNEPASKQAFSTWRQKISPACFQELHEDGIHVCYTKAPNMGLWKGYRVIAVDALAVVLPESKELARAFGRGPSKKGEKPAPPMGRLSEFTDVAMKLVLSGRVRPYATSERAMAKEQLSEVITKMRSLGQKQLLFVYDRGYPSEEFILQHLEWSGFFI